MTDPTKEESQTMEMLSELGIIPQEEEEDKSEKKPFSTTDAATKAANGNTAQEEEDAGAATSRRSPVDEANERLKAKGIIRETPDQQQSAKEDPAGDEKDQVRASKNTVASSTATDWGQRALMYLEDGSTNNVMPQEPQSLRRNEPQDPGAYSSRGLNRRENAAASAVGNHPQTPPNTMPPAIQTQTPIPQPQTSKADLVEALPVDDETVPDRQAQPVDLVAKQQKKQQERKRILLVLLALVVLLVGVIVGVVLGTRKSQEAAINESISSIPTTTPSFAPTGAPSSSPTGALDLLYSSLPNDTLASLQNASTPQWKAYDWLSRHPGLPTMPVWREQQLFALATFFYAFEGPHWPRPIQARWLDYNTSECFWFSSSFGGFFYGEYTGEAIEDVVAFDGIEPCNEHHEFQYLSLTNLQLDRFQPTIPPELALLTSLIGVSLTFDDIKTPMMDEFPTAFLQLSNLAILSLGRQFWNGTLPTQLGLLTHLEDLIFFGNSLRGPIPSELGLLTQLTKLFLDRNTLSGQVPTQFGLLTNMINMQLFDNELWGPIPIQLGMLTSSTKLYMDGNMMTGQVPTEFGLLTQMTWLSFYNNYLTGPLPTELGRMTSLTRLSPYGNDLTGQIPSQLGLLTNMEQLYLYSTFLSGPIPMQMGSLTNMVDLNLDNNTLLGPIPRELARMTGMVHLSISGSGLTGTLPSELALMSSLETLSLDTNALFGPIPSELALMSNLSKAYLNDNFLTSTIPKELNDLVLSGSLGELKLENNSIIGTISNELCLLGLRTWGPGISFDCNEQLCGCCWCDCMGLNGTNSSIDCSGFAAPPPEWPGAFPSPVNTSHLITINIYADEYPVDTTWEWSESDLELWNVVESNSPTEPNSLHSYTLQVESDSEYRLQLFDSFGDGTCCSAGYGWFSVTNSTPSLDYNDGTVVWGVTGDVLGSSLEVIFFVNEHGDVQLWDETGQVLDDFAG